MRRIFFILFLSICLIFGGCDLKELRADPLPPPCEEFIIDYVEDLDRLKNIDPVYNYNNIHSEYSVLFLNDTLFYSCGDSSGDSRYLRWITTDGEYLVASPDQIADSYIHDKIFYDKRKIYFMADKHDGKINRVYSFDLDTAELQNVCKIKGVVTRWFLINNHVVYLSGEELYLYDLQTGSELKISDSIVACGLGVVENKLRYLTRKDNYEVYDYDIRYGITQKVGTIPGNVTFGYGSANFTRNYVVVAEPHQRTLIVCDLKGNVEKYVLPTIIDEFVAADQYAYAILCNNGIQDAGDNAGLYQINLSNGDITRLMDSVDENGILFVQDDQTIYIIPGEYGRDGLEFESFKINGVDKSHKVLFKFDY